MKMTRTSQLSRSMRLVCRSFSSTAFRASHPSSQNRILDSCRTPPAFYDYLRLCSANNTLLLGLFTTSACAPCRTITPLLKSILESRGSRPADLFSGLAFVEVELDSPDTSNGPMMDLGIQYGVTSLPTLIGFGGRRAERVTERLMDTKMLMDRQRMEGWLDEQMQKGDQHPSSGGIGKAVFEKLFG